MPTYDTPEDDSEGITCPHCGKHVMPVVPNSLKGGRRCPQCTHPLKET